MADYYNVTTNIGDAEIAAAIASSTKLTITHIAFGDGNGAVPTPSKARTALVREVHRQAVTKYERHPTNAAWLVIETIIPSNVGGFTIREMGVIANGKLISHGSHAPFEKVKDSTGVSEYRLKFTLNIKDGNVVNITLDQSLIYAAQAWVDENYIPRNEIVDNTTTDDSKKPVSAKQAKKLQDEKLDKTANAVSASKLQTIRNISFSGAATGSFNFDGSANASAILTLANSGVTANTYGSSLKVPVITVNQKGLITGVSEQQIPIVNDLTTGGSNKLLSAEQGKELENKKLDKTANAASASKLETKRRINGVDFDGSQDIQVSLVTNPLAAGQLLSSVEMQNSVWDKATSPLPEDKPASVTAAFKMLNIGNTTWNSQIVIPAYGNEMYLRSRVGSAGAFRDWRAVAFTDSNITGNAATASKLQTARDISLTGDATGSTTFDGSGDVSINVNVQDNSHIHTTLSPLAMYTRSGTDLPNSWDMGVQAAHVNVGVGFPSYGTVLNVRGYSGGGGTMQLYAPYGPSYGGDTLAVRFGNYTVNGGNSWTEFKYLVHDKNITNYAPTKTGVGASGTWGIGITGNAATATKLANPRAINGVNFDGSANIIIADSTKLPTAGGTITGDLTVNGNLTNNRFQSTTAFSFLNGGGAQSINTGGLLASNAYADASKVPTNGIYSKGDIETAGTIKLGSSNLQVVTGSNYTVTYDYATRIAQIKMKILSAASVDSAASPFVFEDSHFIARITLPITLKKRLYTELFFDDAEVNFSYFGESMEWLIWSSPAGHRGATDNLVVLDIVRWTGGRDEKKDGYLIVTGFF